MAVLEAGDACRAFGSGMAAISAAIMSCLQAGDHVVCVDTVYGPTRRLLDDLSHRVCPAGASRYPDWAYVRQDQPH